MAKFPRIPTNVLSALVLLLFLHDHLSKALNHITTLVLPNNFTFFRWTTLIFGVRSIFTSNVFLLHDMHGLHTAYSTSSQLYKEIMGYLGCLLLGNILIFRSAPRKKLLTNVAIVLAGVLVFDMLLRLGYGWWITRSKDMRTALSRLGWIVWALVALRAILFLAKWVFIASCGEVFDIYEVLGVVKRHFLSVKGWMRWFPGSKPSKKSRKESMKRLDDEAVKRSVNEVAASGEQRPPVRPPLLLDSPVPGRMPFLWV
ncbi:hypothetical protein K440DRAFT_680066 [Wilcoxina mikolae CBS 423.85]|nr:hypothetical protein K440DRAFT_680066 [Wilcoxina mikolae CBS 423.85]